MDDADVAFELRTTRGEGPDAALGTEWVVPRRRQWRTDRDGVVSIVNGNAVASLDAQTGTVSIRRGGERLVRDANSAATLAIAALAAYQGHDYDGLEAYGLTLREARGTGGRTLLTVFHGVDRLVRFEIVRAVPADEVAALFAMPRTPTLLTEELQLGRRPRLGLRALWLGRAFNGRRAAMAIQIVDRRSDVERSRGVPAASELTAYLVYYERGTTATSAMPNRLPPAGEVQVLTMSRGTPAAQQLIKEHDGQAEPRHDPWPRRPVTLRDGARATLIFNPSPDVKSYHVLTEGELVIIKGADLSASEVTPLAGRLEPVAG